MSRTTYGGLCRRLGYHFQSEELLERALRHRSVGKDNNERLEFLGDAVLSLVIAEELSRRFPQASEGELSRMRASLVKGATLAKIAREFTLGDHVLLGSGELKSGGHRRDSILADVVEALIGAIYTESGFDITKDCILRWFAPRLDVVAESGGLIDAKTRLQEYLQARGAALPEYTLLNQHGPDHAQIFEVSCQTEIQSDTTVAQAGSRKKAEQAAAALMLQQLGVQS